MDKEEIIIKQKGRKSIKMTVVNNDIGIRCSIDELGYLYEDTEGPIIIVEEIIDDY